MNQPDPVRRVARSDPGRACVILGDRVMSFAEADERADRAAGAWTAHGLAPGDRVAVLAHNEIEYLEWQLAAQRAGLILVPLNTRLAVPELRRIVADAGPSLLVHGPGFEDTAPEIGVERVWHLGATGVGESYEAQLAGVEPRRHEIGDPAALATLLYTSGTTGTAKGAMISNRALLARSMALGLDLRLGPQDVFLQGLPMFHLAQTFSYAFAMVGATNVQLQTFDPVAALAAIERHRVTHTLLVPTIIAMMMERPELTSTDTSSLRALLYGASPIAPAALTAALAAFGCDFHQMYGMTETGPATLLRPAQHDPHRPELLTAAGSAIVTFGVDVVDPDGELVPAGDQGEIVISGPTLMDGYWRDPQATDTVSRGGVLHTGDVGCLDDHGLLRVTDRLKDMIITGGENVVPREVEVVALEHPDVAECAVIGVPDARLGERVHAVLVVAADATVSTAELGAFCRQRLAGYKCPRSWSLRSDLPRTATGKVQRHQVKERPGADLPATPPGQREPHLSEKGPQHA